MTLNVLWAQLGGSVLSGGAQGEFGFQTGKKKHGEVLFPTQVRSCFIIAFGPLIIIWALLSKSRTCANRKKSMINRGLVFFGGVCQMITPLKVLLLFPSVLLTVIMGPSNLPMAALYRLAAG